LRSQTIVANAAFVYRFLFYAILLMILNINKPAGITSHDVVDAVRKITGEKRVGHAGTLDPFATGVLVVAVGRQDTKKLGEINEKSQKEYEALAEFGKTSSTGDPTGTIHVTRNMKYIDETELRSALEQFKGKITQTSPAYSAVRVQGTRAYKLAHKGVRVVMPPRHVTIYELELLEFKPPFAKIRVTCSAGAYIRTLVEDIAKALGTGAYTKELTRTRVSEYTIQDSKTLEELKEKSRTSPPKATHFGGPA